MKKLILSLSSVLLLIACQNKSKNSYALIDKMSWLEGSWENKLPEGTLTETWQKINDSTYSGQTLFIKEKDTIHFEEIVLSQKGETLFYTPTVKGQNNDEPIEFKLTNSNENEFIFENPKHDYPQKIAYKKLNANNLVATISGKQQGKPSSESYPMKRK
ncbi:hypothetical protein GCM10011508_21100 [Flavobacterium lutivivi]|nr:hypothetical protein GCM10011508_21100 [Flavobacterium lutivivi]